MTTPIQYLDKAMVRLRDLGLVPEKTEEAPIVALLNRVSHLDEDKVVAIARTLSQTSLFNQVVREQIGRHTDGAPELTRRGVRQSQRVDDGQPPRFAESGVHGSPLLA